MKKNIAKDFEKKNDTFVLLKICISIINHILIDKGIVTQDELEKYFIKEIKNEKT